MENENSKITTLLVLLQTMYKVSNSKRGLVVAIGTVSKTLFATMDAEDSTYIREQLKLLRNQQELLHAAKSQLKVLNTI